MNDAETLLADHRAEAESAGFGVELMRTGAERMAEAAPVGRLQRSLVNGRPDQWAEISDILHDALPRSS